MSSSYPRLRPDPDRPDDEGKPGALKPAHLLDVLTDGQLDFLKGLTDQQRQRLERQPRLRDGLLPWFHNGPDRILYREAVRLLGGRGRDVCIGNGANGA